MCSFRLFTFRAVGKGLGQAGGGDALCYRTLPNYINCSLRGAKCLLELTHLPCPRCMALKLLYAYTVKSCIVWACRKSVERGVWERAFKKNSLVLRAVHMVQFCLCVVIFSLY